MCAMLCALAMMAACGDKDTNGGVKVSHITFTGCKNHTDKEAKGDPIWGDPDSVSVSYVDGSIHVTHYNLLVNCAFGEGGIIVDLTVEGSTIKIDEHENPNGPLANCMCTTDNSFRIDNIPHGTYTLVFGNWYPEPYSMTVTF